MILNILPLASILLNSNRFLWFNISNQLFFLMLSSFFLSLTCVTEVQKCAAFVVWQQQRKSTEGRERNSSHFFSVPSVGILVLCSLFCVWFSAIGGQNSSGTHKRYRAVITCHSTGSSDSYKMHRLWFNSIVFFKKKYNKPAIILGWLSLQISCSCGLWICLMDSQFFWSPHISFD